MTLIAKKLIDDHLQLLKINRFSQMRVKTRLLVPLDVLVHSESGQRYRGE